MKRAFVGDQGSLPDGFVRMASRFCGLPYVPGNGLQFGPKGVSTPLKKSFGRVNVPGGVAGHQSLTEGAPPDETKPTAVATQSPEEKHWILKYVRYVQPYPRTAESCDDPYSDAQGLSEAAGTHGSSLSKDLKQAVDPTNVCLNRSVRVGTTHLCAQDLAHLGCRSKLEEICNLLVDALQEAPLANP